MSNTSKTSIAAIIFVSIYFLFIIFISLFKGIHLYDLNLNKFHIKHLFIKLDKKLILKIDDLKITTSNKYNKEALKLHQISFYATKILPIFQEITINKLYQNNNLLVNKFILNKDNFYINTSIFSANGEFNIYKNYSIIYLPNLRYKNYIFKNTKIISYYNKKYIFFNIKTHFKNSPIYLAIKTDDNYFYYSIKTKNLSFSYKNNNIELKNFFAKGQINTFFTYNDTDFYIDKFKLKNKNLSINSKQIKGKLKNNTINLNTKYTTSNSKYFKALKLYKLNLLYDLKNKSLLSETKKANILYKKNIIKLKNLTFNYNLTDNTFFIHSKNVKINNEINASSNELIISKLPNIYFYLNDNHIMHKYFNLNNKAIKGNKKLILLSDLIGDVIGFNTLIKSPYIDLNKKEAFSKKIVFNKINFYNTKINFNKKPYTIISSTDTLFNKNIKEVLKKLKINIPLTQLTGKNNLSFKIFFYKKIENILYDFNSSNSKFLIKDINISYKNLKITGDLNNSYTQMKNFAANYNKIKALLDTNTSIFFNKKYINSFVYIKHFNLDSYFKIKNFNEKIVFDLKKKYAYFLNSYIFINLNNKSIYLYSLKKLLKYSVFNKIFQDGNILIKLLNNKILINAYTIIKYPLFLNQKNPYETTLTCEITNNKILIKNKNIQTKILNFEKIYAYLNNLDINIESLIKIINDINEITKNIKSNDSNSPKVYITSNNTNFIYKNHKFLTQKASLIFDKEIHFSANYKKSSLKGYTKNKYLLIEGKNYDKQTLVPLLDFFNHFSYVNLDFILVRSPEDFYTGKIYIKNGAIKDLKVLNNIIAFINTIPALLTLHAPGFSAKGYKIKKGFISYLFFKNILYIKKLQINGINLDFSGKGYIDLNKNYIKMKIHAVLKIKLKKIPIIGKALSYVLFGKDGYLHVNIFVEGDLDNPEIKKDLGGGIIESPLKLFKRIITLPFNIF